MSDICRWTETESDGTETSCGHRFAFESGGVKENGFVFCCWCGKKIDPMRLCWACNKPILNDSDQCQQCTEEIAK